MVDQQKNQNNNQEQGEDEEDDWEEANAADDIKLAKSSLRRWRTWSFRRAQRAKAKHDDNSSNFENEWSFCKFGKIRIK